MKCSKFLIILGLILGVQNPAIADANDDILQDKIKEVRDEIAIASANEIVNKLREFATNAKEAAAFFKSEALGNADNAIEYWKEGADYEKYKMSYKFLIEESKKAEKAAEDFEKMANKGDAITKYMPVILGTLQAAYDSYELYNESKSLQEKYPNFPLKASAGEYVKIVVEGGIGLIPYVGQVYGAIKPERTKFDPHDSMPPSDARDWVEDMTAKIADYQKNGFPQGWIDGTIPPPSGILQYLKGVSNFEVKEYGLKSADWITNWQLIPSQTYGNYTEYKVQWGKSIEEGTSSASCSLGSYQSLIQQGSSSAIGSPSAYMGCQNLSKTAKNNIDPINPNNNQITTQPHTAPTTKLSETIVALPITRGTAVIAPVATTSGTAVISPVTVPVTLPTTSTPTVQTTPTARPLP